MKTEILRFVEEFIQNTKKKVIELASTTLDNKEKKTVLDIYITQFVENACAKMKLSWLNKLVIKKWVVPNIPQLTQYIFDLLKSKLEKLL